MTRRQACGVVLPAGLALTGLSYGPGVLSVLLTWYLVALLMPGATRIRQAGYATFALFAVTASVLTVLSLVSVRCSPSVLASGYVVTATALLLRSAPARLPLLDRHDGWALGLAVVTTVLLAGPLLGSSPGEVMTLLSQTTDGGTHVQMVLGTAKHAGYITFHPVAGMREGMNHYPGGWAGNVWILGHLLHGSDLTPVGTTRLVGVVASASYGLLVFVATRLALALAASLRPILTVGREAFVTALVAMSTTAGFGLFFVNLNSFTQVIAIAAILIAILALWERGSPIRTHLLLAGAVVALAQSWYLLAPILGAVILVALARLPAPRAFLVTLGIAVVPLAAFPVFTGPGAQQVAYRGSQLLPTILGILGLLLVAVIAVVTLMRRRPADDIVRLAWMSAFVAALLLECALLPFRPPDVPGTSYYAGKVLLVLFLLAGTAAAGVAVARTTVRAGSMPAMAIVLGLLSATWSTRDMALPPGLGHTAGHVKSAELDALATRFPHGLPPTTDAWILDGCSRVGDLVASKWMYDLSLTWTESRSAALEDYVYDAAKRVTMLAARANDPSVHAIEIVVGHDCQPANIAELARLPKVTVLRVS